MSRVPGWDTMIKVSCRMQILSTPRNGVLKLNVQLALPSEHNSCEHLFFCYFIKKINLEICPERRRIERQEIWLGLTLCFIYRAQNDLPTLWVIICPSHMQWHFYTVVTKGLKLRRIFWTISSPFSVTLELPAKLLLDSKRASFLLTFCGRRRSYHTNFCSMNSSLPNLHYLMLRGKTFPLENLPAAPQLHTKPINRWGNYLQVFGPWPLGVGRLAPKQTLLTSVLALGKNVQCWQPLMWLFHITGSVDAARARKPPSTAQAGGFCWPCRMAGEENRDGLHLK